MSGHDVLSEQERALAQRLREWPVAGPSAELDARILAQARAEADAGPVPRRRRQRPLLVGLASAAVLVLSVGVIWRVAEQAPESLPRPAPAQPEFRAAPSPSLSEKRSAADAARSMADPNEDLAEADPDAPAAVESTIKREPAPAADIEPDAAPAFAEPPPASPEASVAGRAARTSPAPASGSTPPNLPVPAVPAAPPPPPTPFASPAESFVPTAPSAPARSTPEIAAQRRTGASAAGAVGREQEPPQQAAEERARSEPADRSPLSIGVPDPPSEPRALTGPALAIAHIRRLIVNGRTAAALTRIAELRDNYPDHELPDDLLLFEHEHRQP